MVDLRLATRRGPAADAGALSVRQPEPAARRAGASARSWPKSSATTSIAAGSCLAEAYCGGAGFDSGFRELMRQVFPEPEYKLQLLEPEHPIWYAEEKIDPQQLRPLWGIEFGCRTSVVYVPPDPPARPAAVAVVPVGVVAAGPRREVQPRGPGPRSTPPCRWASTCWPMPPTAN